jgi:HTH-type transcriptional regulator / antitoxin HigA
MDMIEPVVDSRSHQKALRRIERLWHAEPDSREERELDALATLVDVYERRAFPIQQLSPIEAIVARCEQLGWSRRELEPLIGSRARVSEVLTGRRPLTLPMIRNIHRAMGIPAEILIFAQTARARRPARSSERKLGPSVARAAQQRVAPDGRIRVRSPARR